MSEGIDQLVNEIEDDLKQEKYMELWKKYGNAVIGVFLIIIAGVGGHTLYNNYEITQRNETSDIFLDGLESSEKGEPIKAQGIFDEVTGSAHNGYRMLAQFQKASLLLAEKNKNLKVEAREVYKDIASNTKYPQRFRDLAQLRVIALKDVPRDEQNLKSIITKLEPYIKDNAPWRYTALELKAAIFIELNDKLAAAEILSSLVKDPKTPEGIKSRAQIMTQSLSAQIEVDLTAENKKETK